MLILCGVVARGDVGEGDGKGLTSSVWMFLWILRLNSSLSVKISSIVMLDTSTLTSPSTMLVIFCSSMPCVDFLSSAFSASSTAYFIRASAGSMVTGDSPSS